MWIKTKKWSEKNTFPIGKCVQVKFDNFYQKVNTPEVSEMKLLGEKNYRTVC